MGIIDRLLGRTPEQAFAGEVTAVLHRTPGVAVVERGRHDLELRVMRSGSTTPDTMTLDGLFREVRGLSHVDRRAAITQFVRMATGEVRVPGSWQRVSSRLLPAVRPAAHTAGPGGDRRPITWPIAPFLVELVAVDQGETMGFVHEEGLARWGVTADAARLAAHQNLTRKGIDVVSADELPGAWSIAGPPSCQSSWLAAPSRLAEAVATKVDGVPLVLAPARDHALVVGDDDPAGVSAALRWAEAAYRDDRRSVSPVAYRLDRRRIEPWMPEPDHPCRRLVERSHSLLAGQAYTDQREHLQALLDAAGEDVYVAEIYLNERPDGRLVTWAVWSELVATSLLPVADYVAIEDSSGTAFWITWADLLTEAGHLLPEDPGWGLPRHRPTTWPDPTLLTRLHTHATTP